MVTQMELKDRIQFFQQSLQQVVVMEVTVTLVILLVDREVLAVVEVEMEVIQVEMETTLLYRLLKEIQVVLVGQAKVEVVEVVVLQAQDNLLNLKVDQQVLEQQVQLQDHL